MRLSPAPPSASALLAATAAALLAVIAAASTLEASWVGGGGLLPLAALVGCLVGLLAGFLGLSPEAPWSVALALESGIAAAVGLTALDVHALPFGLAPSAVSADDQLGLALLYGTAWAASALLGWTVAGGRRPLPALAPLVALVAVNALNHPDRQEPYAVAVVVVSLLLLMAAHHARLVSALHREALAAGGRRYWAAGGVIALAVVGATLLPPASSVDLTTGGPWQALSQLGSNGVPGSTAAAGGVVGLSTSAGLFGGITEGPDEIVFTYSPDPQADAGPYYFRAVDLVEAANGEWLPPPPARATGFNAGGVIGYAESYSSEVPATVTVQYVHPVVAPAGLVVFPGRLLSSDRATYSRQAPGRGGGGGVLTLDSLQSRVLGGRVVEQVAFPDPTESQLRSAGTDYPEWVRPYAGADTSPGYRSAAVLGQVAALARQVAGGAGNPYDAALAIQDYLRGSAFTYTLAPPDPPPGTDPLAYFLFTSRQGYCQYFAIAMGDMLRSLGIPTRLVNGFGPGSADPGGGWSVRTSDAHTWVESYFPGYGWIPFEPTPDGTYFPIQRAPETQAAAPADAPAETPAGGTAAPTAIDRGTAWIAARRADIPYALVLAILAALAVLLAAASASRPRSAAAAWRRLRWLTAAAGQRQLAGETPLEFGDRLARWRPALAPEIRLLAQRYTTAAYAPPARAAGSRDAVLGAWRSVRSALLRQALKR